MDPARKKLLDKIKKCLRLAASPNEHEAAAALRQAQKMMRDAGITEADVLASEAGQAVTRAGATRRPAQWEVNLAAAVATAFGCQVHLNARWQGRQIIGEWVFVGIGAQHELAAYTMAVMTRQAKAARATHTRTYLPRCKAATRVRRADLFCEGWVSAVRSQITAFAMDDRARLAIAAYCQQSFDLVTGKTTDRNDGRKLAERELGDYAAGHHQGRSAQLRRPVGADQRDALEG